MELFCRIPSGGLCTSDVQIRREQSLDVQVQIPFFRDARFRHPLVNADIFGAGQRHDQLRPGALGLSTVRLRRDHGAFVRLFLRALCDDEHLRRRAVRPLGQKAHDALVRPFRGADHLLRAAACPRGAAAHRPSLHPQRPQRPDEYAAKARRRRDGEPARAPRALSARRRHAGAGQRPDHGARAGAGLHALRLRRAGDGRLF